MNLLEVRGVTKSFGGIQALNGCGLELREGEIGGLIGPNGSGKTTLFNVVTGYERADAGAVEFRGKGILRRGPGEIFHLGIGRTFQLTRVFGRLTAVENLHVAAQRSGLRALVRGWSASQEKERALSTLEYVGLANVSSLPAASLSYGQRKLLEFASILMAQPSVILLDEPAGGVNPTMIGFMADRIRDLNRQGTTFLIVEHNMTFVMDLCHRVTVMHRGATIATGEPAEIRSNRAVLDAYLGD
ncbi:MAG: ABC transporter ATP-binding protein [Chloroflexota bacterium]